MDRFDSMHISTMSARDIEHNQTMRHVPAPVRSLLFGSRAKGVSTEDLSIARGREAGTIPVRVYRPDGAEHGDRPVVLYFHGGGWTLFGGLDMGDWLPSRLSADLAAVVIAVDYRLAPQHPYPAGFEDCWDAVRWAASQEGARLHGGDAARLAVVGDSAGGNLAAAISLKARDAGGPALRAQGLIYPVTSYEVGDASMHENATAPILHRDDMVAFLALYTQGETATLADPFAFPDQAESLRRLPPALVQVGSHDVLRDQGRRYAERLAANGTEVETIEYPGAPHGWITYPRIMAISKRATADLVAFLSERLA